MLQILKTKDVFYKYDSGSFKLNNINLTINKGEFVSILGSRNSGKSTLAKLLAGIIFPLKGNIYIDDLDNSIEENLWEIRIKTGIVFQNPENQIIGSTVFDDVSFMLQNIGLSETTINEYTMDSLKSVGLFHLRNNNTSTLSGGQKQKLVLASVISSKPKVLILDEVTSMLDHIDKKNLFKLLINLNKNTGLTIINIAHDLDYISHSNRIIVLDKGSILYDLPYCEVFQNKNNLIKLGIGIPMIYYLK
ncbi:MAG: ATP-binding cassette domain-containing protein [Clostridiales bacterium]